MSSDSSASRAVPPDMDSAEVDLALHAIAMHFGRRWLDEQQPHPIRLLWANPDAGATCQLFWLGWSLRTLNPLDASWVTDVVGKMKSDNPSRVGFAFELLALAMFSLGGHKVTLAKPGQEGYDGDIQLETSSTLRLSLKNFGTTKHAKTFAGEAAKIRNALVDRAKTEGVASINLLAIATKHPRSRDWGELAAALAATNLIETEHAVTAGEWTVEIRGQSGNPAAGPGWLSSSVLIAAPHHDNEYKNFLDKIASECGTLNRRAREYGETVQAAVMFRLSESAPLRDYVAWATDYLNQEKTCLAGVIFMQTAVTYQTADSTTSISHHASTAWRDGVSPPMIKMQAPVGLISLAPIREVLYGGDQALELAGMDWYNAVESFAQSQLKQDGLPELTIPSHPPGTVIHGILEIPGGGNIILSPRHKSPDHILLYD